MRLILFLGIVRKPGITVAENRTIQEQLLPVHVLCHVKSLYNFNRYQIICHPSIQLSPDLIDNSMVPNGFGGKQPNGCHG